MTYRIVLGLHLLFFPDLVECNFFLVSFDVNSSKVRFENVDGIKRNLMARLYVILKEKFRVCLEKTYSYSDTSKRLLANVTSEVPVV